MSLRRALTFSYLEKYGSYVVGLVSTMVISRLLGPQDIGAFSVAMAVVGVVAVIRELGVSTYIVQEVELTPERIRAAFTLTVTAGIGLGFLVLLLSWPAGLFYDDRRVTGIMVVLAVGFAITPFGSISQSLLSRELRYDVLAWIRLVHSAVLAIVGIALVWFGVGPISLAWALCAAATSSALLSICVRPHPHRLSYRAADLRRVLAVGGPTTGTVILEDIAFSLPELLLGRSQGLREVGLFSRSRGLSQLAQQVLARAASPVLFSAYAERARGGGEMASLYLRATYCITAIGWSGLATIAVMSAPVVRVLFGAQWSDMISIVPWLCLAAAITLLTSGSANLLVAAGAPLELFRTRLYWFPAHVGFVLVGAAVSLVAVAIATVVSSATSTWLYCRALRKQPGIPLSEQKKVIVRSGSLAFLSGCGASVGLLAYDCSLQGSVAALVLGGVGASILFVAGAAVSAHPIVVEVKGAISAARANR